MRAPLTFVAMLCGPIAIFACTNDFDQFESSKDTSDAISSDGGPGSEGGSDSSAPRDAASDAKTCGTCVTERRQCSDACSTTYVTCSTNCPGNDFDCRNNCRNDRDSCRRNCTTTCTSCGGQQCASQCD